MKRSYRPAFDTSYKDAVGIVLMFLHKVARSLLGWNGDQRYSFIGRLEPDDFRLVLLAVLVTAAVSALGFLLFFRSLAARAE